MLIIYKRDKKRERENKRDQREQDQKGTIPGIFPSEGLDMESCGRISVLSARY